MIRPRDFAPAITLACALLVGALACPAAAQTKPEGEMRWALYVTLSPVWFDPAEVSGQLTPFCVLYAIHDALVKPMPGNLMSPSLAESWTVSADQRVYEFKLREVLRDQVREVVVGSPSRVRFVLHEPWPDFMTCYRTMVSGARWVVPKKYI